MDVNVILFGIITLMGDNYQPSIKDIVPLRESATNNTCYNSGMEGDFWFKRTVEDGILSIDFKKIVFVFYPSRRKSANNIFAHPSQKANSGSKKLFYGVYDAPSKRIYPIICNR